MSILSKNIKLLRKESFLSFEEIVEKIGVTEEEFLKWEEGLEEPNDLILERVCQVLKMPFEDIKERDLTLEREEALSQMKKTGTIRKNYDWYFGSKSEKLFHIGYIAYFIIGLVAAFFVANLLQKSYGDLEELLEFYPGYTIEELKMVFYFQSLISCLSVYSFGASVFILIWYFKRHTFTFSWWYILWFSVLLTVMTIIGAIGCIPFFIYSIIKLFPKNKKA
ncbi:MAG: helix-turn-helix transcriptional regulator [Bacilli bacterium]|nr:helix-turn-helix transcriptional regulator [Bacilli bacterium]